MPMLREILVSLLLPLPVCVELLLLGTILLWWGRWQTAARILLTAGTVLLLVVSLRPLPYLLLSPLESRYPPIAVQEPPDSTLAGSVKWVVVLGGGHSGNPRIPVSSRLTASSLARLVEGIRLYRQLPGSRLLLSGGGAGAKNSDAGIMADVAAGLGIDRRDIVLDTRSEDTEDQAVTLAAMLKDEKFILVTSAAHMPRAMGLFARLGVHPIPAPTDYTMKSGNITPGTFYPNDASLAQLRLALHEILGTFWAAARGRL